MAEPGLFHVWTWGPSGFGEDGLVEGGGCASRLTSPVHIRWASGRVLWRLAPLKPSTVCIDIEDTV